MPRNEKYHFVYTGFDSGTHNFETVQRRLNNTPRWTAFIDPSSFSSSKVKFGAFNYILKGHFQDDSPYVKNLFFYITESLTVCAGTTEKIWIESEDNFPLPKYACDFLRALIKKIEDWETEKGQNKISVGYRIAT